MNGHALITGGSSGIGLALARRLSTQGMDITLIARGESRLERALAEVKALQANSGQRFLTLAADVGDKTQATESVNTAIRLMGVPRLLITSAGVARPGYFEELPDGVFEETMRVNYFGTLYVIRAAAAAMRAEKTGRIVLISSAAGLIGIFGYTAYSPTKFALRGLAESLRSELERDGVEVSIVYPPDTRTPQLEEENKTKPEETMLVSSSTATWEPDDVAQVIERGIRARSFAITPGWETTALCRLSSLINPLLAWHFDRLVRRHGRRSRSPGDS